MSNAAYAGADAPQVAYSSQPQYSAIDTSPEVYHPQTHAPAPTPYQQVPYQSVPQSDMYQNHMAYPPQTYQAQAEVPVAQAVPEKEAHTLSTPSSRKQRPLWRSYLFRFAFNAVIFGMTVHGVWKINNDTIIYDGYLIHEDYLFSSWTSLKFCVAISTLAWFAIAYCATRDANLWTLQAFKGGKPDVLGVCGLMVILWLVAGSMQAAFVSSSFVCGSGGACGSLVQTSYNFEVTDAIFAFLNLIAWAVPLVFAGLEYQKTRKAAPATSVV